MADPRYRQTEEYQPVQDTAAGQADDANAQMYGNISKAAFGIAQQAADNYASQKGLQDAIAGGKDFKNASELTEAGREYNKAGNPIAQSSALTQLANNFQDIYLKAVSNGLTADSQANMNAQMVGATKGVVGNLDPNLQRLVTLHGSSLAQQFQNKFSTKLLNVQQTQAELSQHHETENQLGQLSSSSFAAGMDALADNPTTAAGVNAKTQQIILQGQLQNSVKLGQMTGPQAEALYDRINYTQKSSALNGMIHNSFQNYFTSIKTGITQNPKVLQDIEDLPNMVYKNSAFAQLSPANKSKLFHQAQALVKSNLTSYVGDQKELNVEAKVQTSNSVHGRPIDQSVMNRMRAAHPDYTQKTFNPQIEANQAANSYVTKLNMGKVSGMKAGLQDLDNPNGEFAASLGDTRPDIKQTAIKNAKALLQAKMKAYENDPQTFINNQPSHATLINNTAATLTVPADRQEYKKIVVDPTTWDKPATPAVRKALSNTIVRSLKDQKDKGSLSTQLKPMDKASATLLASSLNGLPEDQKDPAISNLQLNTGNAFSHVTRQLINHGADFGTFFLHSLFKTDANRQEIADAQEASNRERNAVYGKNESQLYSTPNGKSNLMKRIFNTEEAANTINPYLGSVSTASPQTRNDIKNLITNYVAFQMKKENHDPSDVTPLTVYVENAAKLFVGSQYSEVDGGYRIPRQVRVPTSLHGSSSQDLDSTRVHILMNDYSDKLASHMDVKDYVDAQIKATGKKGQRDILTQATLASKTAGATWKSLPDDSGMYMVDTSGHAVMNKNTHKVYGFSFQDALPGSQNYPDDVGFLKKLKAKLQ